MRRRFVNCRCWIHSTCWLRGTTARPRSECFAAGLPRPGWWTFALLPARTVWRRPVESLHSDRGTDLLMKIAIIVDSLAKGGAERQALYSARELARRGHE